MDCQQPTHFQQPGWHIERFGEAILWRRITPQWFASIVVIFGVIDCGSVGPLDLVMKMQCNSFATLKLVYLTVWRTTSGAVVPAETMIEASNGGYALREIESIQSALHQSTPFRHGSRATLPNPGFSASAYRKILVKPRHSAIEALFGRR